MRIVVLILFLANVSFLGWSVWQDSQADSESAAAPVAPLQLATAPSLAATRCKSLGPFVDSTEILSASAALTARGFGSLVRQVDHKIPDGTWVFVAGLKSVAERQRVLQKLKHAGISDVADVSDGQYIDRVSAGIFVEPEGARARAAKVRAAGFEPGIEERQRTVAERWLNVQLNAGATPLAPADLGIPDADTRQIGWTDCPVAPAVG